MKTARSALVGLAMLGVAASAQAQNEQFIPMNGYWVGPYARRWLRHLRRIHRLREHDQRP